jgi:hypothetical protein
LLLPLLLPLSLSLLRRRRRRPRTARRPVRHSHSMPACRRSCRHPGLLLVVIALGAAAALTATSAFAMYAPRRQGAAFTASAGNAWLRPTSRSTSSSASGRSRSSSTLAASASASAAHARRRPSSLGFLSAVTMLAAPRGGWATTSSTGNIPTTGAAAAANAAGAGFCPAPFSTTSSPQTCLAASASNTATATAAPTSATAKKTLQPKYRLSYRPPDYWIRHTDLTFQIEPDPVCPLYVS